MGMALNVAVIDLFLSMVTLSGFVVPVASPLHPENIYPTAGVAVMACTDPWSNVPAVSESVPEPTTAVARVYWGIAVNVAVMALFLSIVTLSGLVVPVASPLHPENINPAAGVAVMLCTEAWSNVPEAGETVPEPTTVVVNVNVTVAPQVGVALKAICAAVKLVNVVLISVFEASLAPLPSHSARPFRQ